MKIAQPFELKIISVRHTNYTDQPAYNIYGELTTSCRYAYGTKDKRCRSRWAFDALMVAPPGRDRYFVRIAPLSRDAPDFVRDLVGEHLRNLDLSGMCRLNSEFKSAKKKQIKEIYE
jgi:hypothetical protein